MTRWIALTVVAALAQTTARAADDTGFYGPLRARDLTPFGFLRLDMRPVLGGFGEPGAWAVATEVAYQNTWALSRETEKYLGRLPGRRQLGPAEFQAIRDLPGENFLIDLELAQFDMTLYYQLSHAWSAYLILSGATYQGGFLDGMIERFHDAFAFSNFGRPAANRNDVNILLDLKSSQYAAYEAPTSGGLLDPTLGVRYSGIAMPENWKLVLEGAAKIPVAGRREMLSSGRVDFGVQATLQRYWQRQAFYANLSGVYYAGTGGFMPSDAQVIPTLVLGYELKLSARTNAIIQGYASPSVYTRADTDLDELTATKFQISLGVHHRRGAHLFTFAATENLQNFNNTPDIGFQLGWAYVAGRPLRP
jgi:hypothetical protein